MKASVSQTLGKTRLTIAERVRELRRGRRWTQAHLAAELDISQGHLSQLERGDGSFSAEQLLRILRLFNAPLSQFDSAPKDTGAELQNTLARLGAHHLRENPDVLVGARLELPAAAIREALVEGAPRLIAALAPVLVSHADRINLRKLHAQLSEAGLEQRLAWLVENTLEAVRNELERPLPAEWGRLYRRAELVLATFVGVVNDIEARRQRPRDPARELDVLDAEIRSARTLEEVREQASSISQRWGIVTRLVPGDFARALEAARVVR